MLVGCGLVAAEILAVAESWSRLHEEEQFFFIFVLQPFSEEPFGGHSRRSRKRRNCWREHDPQYQQWKKRRPRRRAVELQEQAEVLAKVVKEQFYQTMNALSPSPHYPHRRFLPVPQYSLVFQAYLCLWRERE